jgi:hypothetical protein
MTTRVQKNSSKPALLSILTWVKKKEKKPTIGFAHPKSTILYPQFLVCLLCSSIHTTFLSPSSHALACISIFFFSLLLPVQIINYSTRTSHAPY